MPTEVDVRASVRELPVGRALLTSASERAAVVANPLARPTTRQRAATEAKATLSLLISGALRHDGTPEEKEWWALHRAASELRETVTRHEARLTRPTAASKPQAPGPKAGVKVKSAKGKKRKLDQSLAARKERLEKRNAQLARNRKAAKKSSVKKSVRTVSGGLPGLGKR